MSSSPSAHTRSLRRGTTNGSAATTPSNQRRTTHESSADFFEPTQWALFGWAHQRVGVLVMNDGPYRAKAIDLAQHSITKLPQQRQRRFKPEDVVAEAWSNVSFLWGDPQTDTNIYGDASCAYTSMANTGDVYFPVIAFSSAFRANDSPSGQLQPDQLTMDQARTLLLFFRKIKHEFLHVVHRFLNIKYKGNLRERGTPEKYTPIKKNSRGENVPEVGDHDEEEDSGGPIVPWRFDLPLSPANPLCVYIDGKFKPLSDIQVLDLLSLDLYSVQVPSGRHDIAQTRYHLERCRAATNGVLTIEFLYGEGIAAPVYPRRAASSQRSRSSSPATSLETNDTDDSELEEWRRNGNVPIPIPEHFFTSPAHKQQFIQMKQQSASVFR